MKQSKFFEFLKRIILTVTFIAVVSLFFWSSVYLNKRQSFEYKAQKILVNDKAQIKQILFSPNDNIQDVLIGLIEAEKEKVCIAIYTFTSKNIVKALENAQDRGVNIEIVTDGESSLYQYSAIKNIKQTKIPLWIYPNYSPQEKSKMGIMHHKFLIFRNSILNKSILCTGSYNLTKSANNKNQENMIIIDDPIIISAYQKQFEILKNRSEKWQ